MRSRSVPDHTSRTPRRLGAAAAATALALGAGALVAPPAYAAPTEIQILATNDFHGRLQNNTSNGEAGAAVLAGAVGQLRAANPNTVFAAAGDLIGASTFESFIQQDKPTIDALNDAGLDVSAVGNHELDQGYSDLVDRVMAPFDPTTNPFGGAQWQYIAANLKLKGTDDPAVPETWIKEFGDVQVGFVGAVTEQLPTLVSPGGITQIDVAPIVQSVNEAAAELVAGGADLVVMLVHEGSGSTDCATMDDPGSAWADIVNGISADVDAIVSGHTHLAYNCSFPVQAWIDEGRTVTDRPVVSAGQYGTNLNQLVYTVDGATGVVSAKSQAILPLENSALQPLYPADPEVAAIVAQAVIDAEGPGGVRLGDIAGAFNRAQTLSAAGARIEARGAESTLGNLVAEVQQWATESAEAGSAEIAFMNPGGLRQDMTGTDPGNGSYPRTVTYKQAAVVQPFANTLVNMQLTGAQIKTVLEQQWQPRDSLNRLLTRPFLRLGVSEGFEYTYRQDYVTEFPLDNPATPDVDESLTPYQRAIGTVTGMWLHGEPIDPAATYSVTVNSFLSTGGDNFFEFANGTDKRDTGKVDLSAMVDYMAAFADDAPLPVDYAQRAVEVRFAPDAPATYAAGSTVAFDVKSWSMSTTSDLRDTELVVSLGGQVLGTFPVDSTLAPNLYDDLGSASVSVILPTVLPAGQASLVLTGAATKTQVEVPLTIVQGIKTTISAKVKVGKKGAPSTLEATVKGRGSGAPGSIVVSIPGQPAIVAALEGGKASVELPALPKGTTVITVTYPGNGVFKASQTTVKAKVK
jgi:5'-nucleotidase